MYQRNNRGFRGKPQGKKSSKPRYGGMYLAKSKSGERLYRLTIDAKAFEVLEPDERGRIHFIGFKNNYKETEQHPDVIFYFSEPLSKPDGGRSAPRPKSRPAPVQSDDDEDEGLPTTPSDDNEDDDSDESDSQEESDDDLPF